MSKTIYYELGDGGTCLTKCPYYNDGRKVCSIMCQDMCEYNIETVKEDNYVVCEGARRDTITDKEG